MRSVIIPALLFVIATTVFSCKKKDKDPEPAPAPAPATPAHVNSMTAKVNGASWAMGSSGGIAFTSTSRVGMSYYFGGNTAMSEPYTSIGVSFFPSTGTFTLSKYGQYRCSYKQGGNYFYSVTGTLNISQLDTGASYGLPKIFKCTFSFMTDTVGGQSYNVTEGATDYEKGS